MRMLDPFFTRRRRLPRFADISDRTRRRLDGACRELIEAENRIAARLNIPDPPRLLLIDEEVAVVVSPEQREEITAAAARLRP